MTGVEVRIIPVPNPTGGVSVYFAPKFLQSDPLGTYPDWKNWPAVIGNPATSMDVEMFDVSTSTWTNVAFGVSSANPNPNVWKALFGFPSTLLTGKYNYLDRESAPVLAWDGAAAVALLNNFYDNISDLFPIDPPLGSQIPNAAKAAIVAAGQDLRDSLIDEVGGSEDLLGSWNVGHILAAAGQHPKLLRMLGMVVDISIGGNISDMNGIRVGLPSYGGGAGHIVFKESIATKLQLGTLNPERLSLIHI